MHSPGTEPKRSLRSADTRPPTTSRTSSPLTHVRSKFDLENGLRVAIGTTRPYVCQGCKCRWKLYISFVNHVTKPCPRPYSNHLYPRNDREPTPQQSDAVSRDYPTATLLTCSLQCHSCLNPFDDATDLIRESFPIHSDGAGHYWICLACKQAGLDIVPKSTASHSLIRIPKYSVMVPRVGFGARTLPLRRPIARSREELTLPTYWRFSSKRSTLQRYMDGGIVGGRFTRRAAPQPYYLNSADASTSSRPTPKLMVLVPKTSSSGRRGDRVTHSASHPRSLDSDQSPKLPAVDERGSNAIALCALDPVDTGFHSLADELSKKSVSCLQEIKSVNTGGLDKASSVTDDGDVELELPLGTEVIDSPGPTDTSLLAAIDSKPSTSSAGLIIHVGSMIPESTEFNTRGWAPNLMEDVLPSEVQDHIHSLLHGPITPITSASSLPYGLAGSNGCFADTDVSQNGFSWPPIGSPFNYLISPPPHSVINNQYLSEQSPELAHSLESSDALLSSTHLMKSCPNPISSPCCRGKKRPCSHHHIPKGDHNQGVKRRRVPSLLSTSQPINDWEFSPFQSPIQSATPNRLMLPSHLPSPMSTPNVYPSMINSNGTVVPLDIMTASVLGPSSYCGEIWTGGGALDSDLMVQQCMGSSSELMAPLPNTMLDLPGIPTDQALVDFWDVQFDDLVLLDPTDT